LETLEPFFPWNPRISIGSNYVGTVFILFAARPPAWTDWARVSVVRGSQVSGWERSSPGVGRASTSAGCSQTPAASLTRHRIFVSVHCLLNRWRSSLGLGRAMIPAGCSQTPAASLTRHRIFVSVQSRVSGYEGGEGIDIGRLFTNPGRESNTS
jgi:hypothetical protein